jgi:hypothetical protein
VSKLISHHLDVYGAKLYLARERDEWTRLKKQTGFKLDKIDSVGLTQLILDRETGQVHFCVFIDVRNHPKGELIQTCAHEAAHIAGMMLDHIDTDYDGHSEPFAYLVGWTTTWLWEHVRKS